MAHWSSQKHFYVSKRYLIILGVIGVICILGYGLRRPLLENYRVGKANRLIEESHRFAEKGQWRDAYARLKEVGHRLPHDFETIRFSIEVVVEAGEPVNGELLKAAYFQEAASPADQGWILGLTLDGGDQLMFSQLYNALSEEQRDEPEIILVKARFLYESERFAELVALAKSELEKTDGEDAVLSLWLAKGLIGRRESETDLVAAQELITALMTEHGPSAEGRAGFRLLNRVPLAAWRPDLLPDLDQWLARMSNPDPEVADWLILETARLADIAESEREAHADQVANERAGKGIVAVADWLIGMGFPEKAVALLDPEEARADLALYEKRLAALVATRDGEAALKWLEKPHPEADAVSIWLTQARIADAMENQVEWRRCLNHAFFSADILTSRNAFFEIHDEARRMGDLKLAARAALRGVGHPLAVIPPSDYFGPVLGYLWREGRIDDCRFLLRGLLRREPSALHLLNNEIYLSFLQLSVSDLEKAEAEIAGNELDALEADETSSAPEKNGESSRPTTSDEETNEAIQERLIEMALGLVGRVPDRLGYRTTAALGLLEAGRIEEAEAMIDAIPEEGWIRAGTADHAIAVLVLAKAGRKEEAAQQHRSGLEDLAGLNQLERDLLGGPASAAVLVVSAQEE